MQAIRVVAAGAALLDPAVTRRVIEEFARNPATGPRPPEVNRLTDRELEVLHLVARGLSNAEIAATLVVSEATVKTHVARMLDKLGYATASKPSSTPTNTDWSDPAPDQEDHRDRRSAYGAARGAASASRAARRIGA